MKTSAMVLVLAMGGPALAAPPAGQTEPRIPRQAEDVKRRWSALTLAPEESPGVVMPEGSVLSVGLRGEGLPDEGLGSFSYPGQVFSVVSHGNFMDDRRIIAPGSVLHGEVLEAEPLRENPFRPAKLRVIFYKLEEAAEGLVAPLQAMCVEAGGWEVSAGGSILGHQDIALREGDGFLIKLLKPLTLHLGETARGIGVWGKREADGYRLTAVAPASSAAMEGLEVGDKILDIDGNSLAKAKSNPWELLYGMPGSRVSLTVLKAGQKKPAKIQCLRGVRAWEGTGLSVQKDPRGVQVVRVIPGSPAEEAGILPGGLILTAGGADFAPLSLEECIKHLRLRAGAKVALRYLAPDARDPVDVALVVGKIHDIIRP